MARTGRSFFTGCATCSLKVAQSFRGFILKNLSKEYNSSTLFCLHGLESNCLLQTFLKLTLAFQWGTIGICLPTRNRRLRPLYFYSWSCALHLQDFYQQIWTPFTITMYRGQCATTSHGRARLSSWRNAFAFWWCAQHLNLNHQTLKLGTSLLYWNFSSSHPSLVGHRRNVPKKQWSMM